MEQSFLQKIKLEISRNFRLDPYERIAFHNILGILKSENGKNILLNELDRGEELRESALSVLQNFGDPQVTEIFCSLLKTNLLHREYIYILSHLGKYGSYKNVADVSALIEKLKYDENAYTVIYKAFHVLETVSGGSEDALHYIISFIEDEENSNDNKGAAISVLSSFRVISVFEDLLKRDEDYISYSVYNSLYKLNIFLNEMAKAGTSEEDKLYTYSPEAEDKIILDIRVLLGKMAHKFDEYTDKTKVAYICCTMSCNHREFLIYVMKALTSRNADLITMTLYALQTNIHRLRDPDKLFRNLIALTTENSLDNDLIVDIFHSFFTLDRDTRQFNIMKDKIYNYIVVTLETYFETFRREFIIKDVLEKGYPENFQRIRDFILNRFTPELKKNLINYLKNESTSVVNHLLDDASEVIHFIPQNEKDNLKLFIEILFEEDEKSREISFSRLEDINFDKRYLRNRIVRLSRIISRLYIHESASALVNIFNYLKKYPDEEILENSIHSLSVLNYSYMLSEIEVILKTGSDEEVEKGFELLSLFSEQRSLNILFEYLQDKTLIEDEKVKSSIRVLVDRDILGNMTANELFKRIIENNPNVDIISHAVIGVGKTALDNDITYLNNLFSRFKQSRSKDVIVRAIGDIISQNPRINKREAIKILQDYLKDPGIKVRIYSCLLLVKLGNKEALNSIRDMLVIKNKDIQRDILTILGDLRSVEFSFFLVSLLKEEYGMTYDIINVLKILPEEELNEIDGFIVNIFRKFEAPDFATSTDEKPSKEKIIIDNLKTERLSVLHIHIKHHGADKDLHIHDLININLKIKSLIDVVISENNGTISSMSNDKIIATFTDPLVTIETSNKIIDNIENHNRSIYPDRRINVINQVFTTEIRRIGEEIFIFPEYRIHDEVIIALYNKTIVDDYTYDFCKENYHFKEIIDLVFLNDDILKCRYELISPINFSKITKEFLKGLMEEEDKKNQFQQKLEEEMKKLKMKGTNTRSAEITRDLDNIGSLLHEQLEEIERYVERRITDRETIKNVRKMLNNVENLYKVEISRIIVD